MAMSARLAVPHVFLPAIIAINFISFTHYIDAQQCHMAHDKNALKVLQERAASGDADAQCGLGKQYEFALGVPQDNKQAALWLQKSAEQGNIIAQVELGVVYDKMQDYAQAFTWYSKATEQGNARAQFNLGLCYLNGEFVPKDTARAIELFRKAANQGDAIAQSELGVMYEHGVGVPQDYLQAADWYRKAAEQGLAEAQYGLGFLYHNGKGVPKDDTQATTWWLKAAEQGESKAQYNLGVRYINGTGVNRDLNEGYFWIFLANTRTTNSGLKGYAENSLEALTKVMKKNDIKNAQKRAQAWLNEHPLKAEEVVPIGQIDNTTP
jgi:TPR repeat protein